MPNLNSFALIAASLIIGCQATAVASENCKISRNTEALAASIEQSLLKRGLKPHDCPASAIPERKAGLPVLKSACFSVGKEMSLTLHSSAITSYFSIVLLVRGDPSALSLPILKSLIDQSGWPDEVAASFRDIQDLIRSGGSRSTQRGTCGMITTVEPDRLTLVVGLY